MDEGERDITDIERGWRGFLQRVELAKNHDGLYTLEVFSSRLPKNPITEAIFPTLLFVQLVSLLDNGLEAHRKAKGKKFPPKARYLLFDRINLLSEDLKSPADLHVMRKKRAQLAHDPGRFVTWSDLDDAIYSVEQEFRTLNLAGERPRYKFFAERSGAESSDDPRVAFEQEYKFGLKHNDEVVLSLSWKDKVLRASALED